MNGKIFKILSFGFFIYFSFLSVFVFAGRKKYEKVPGGVDTLIQVSKDQKEMESVLKAETRAYEKIKDAIDDKKIFIGLGASDISDKYGDPVVKVKDRVKNTEKWVYKPGYATFFSEEQVWIIFDNADKLKAIQYPPSEPQKSE